MRRPKNGSIKGFKLNIVLRDFFDDPPPLGELIYVMSPHLEYSEDPDRLEGPYLVKLSAMWYDLPEGSAALPEGVFNEDGEPVLSWEACFARAKCGLDTEINFVPHDGNRVELTASMSDITNRQEDKQRNILWVPSSEYGPMQIALWAYFGFERNDLYYERLARGETKDEVSKDPFERLLTEARAY